MASSNKVRAVRPNPGGSSFARLISTAQRLWPVLVAPVICVSMLTGCVSSSRKIASYQLDQPRINQGVLTEEAKEDGLRQMARMLQETRASRLAPIESEASNAPGPVSAGATRVPAVDNPNPDSHAAGDPPTAGPPALDQPPSSEKKNNEPALVKAEDLPPESAHLIPLPKLSVTEINELLAGLQLHLQTEKGYSPATDSESRLLPELPGGISPGPVLTKSTASNVVVIRFGHRRFLSQPPQLWVQGAVFDPKGGSAANNPDLETIGGMVEGMLASMEQMKKGLTGQDLAYRLIQLSYIDVPGAMTALKGLGVNTADDLAKMTNVVPFESLPIVAPMPSPSEKQTGLIGEKSTAAGAFQLSITPAIASSLPGNANTAPASQLIVFFHQAHPEQFGRVKHLLDELIDKPARQVFVEGMVLEISEDGLKDLGIEWEFREGNFAFIVGTLATGGLAESTLQATFDDLKNMDKNWIARLKALVRDGKAEVLSRPSVLTLDNRQATIRVGTDIPIATLQEQGVVTGGLNKTGFSFTYLATGISLNVLPRVNEKGDEVSLLIDTVVSAVVPGADLELRSTSGEVLAAAPTVSTRRIQTYARIENSTPFIIGGLVSKEHTVVRNKVPLLGDIPYMGVLFRSKRDSTVKREVIIVLTPHVLVGDKERALGRYLPKDEDRFDDFDNKLFRDTYRIRTEDVFDLTFLFENQRLQQFRQLAARAIQQDFRLAQVEPFSHFAGDRIPGEQILVHRMIYEVIKRLSPQERDSQWLNQRVNSERLILFESEQTGGYNVQFLERLLSKLGTGKQADDFFRKHRGEALAITFFYDRQTFLGKLDPMPIPEISLIACPDRRAWSQLLWQLNQPEPQGHPRQTILIQDESDLVRLQRGVLLKKIASLNGGRSQMTLNNFSLGKVLLMPEVKPDQTNLIDPEVAQYFFHTEHYYSATIQVIEQTLRTMEQALKQAGLQGLFD